MRKFLLAFALVAVVLSSGTLKAQDDDTEYLMEIGPALGGSFYMGDANTTLYRDTRLMGGAVVRYRFNPRFALKADITVAGIAGSTANIKDRTFPREISFRRSIIDFGVQAEGNFLAYGTTTYNNCHRLVPYYLMGIGLTYAPAPAKHDFAANFPIGIGVKYKIADRLNLSLEWTMRFSTSDRLDVTDRDGEDPFGIKSGFMKNRDSYCFTMLMLTYDIFAKPCNCN